MSDLVLGPLLRYAGDTEATVWVEADSPCEVEVLGHRARTFHVEGHHYALVVIGGLRPGGSTEYAVSLDGERRWPPERSRFPPSVIRTVAPERPLRIAFGSCRVSLPHEAPYTLSPDEDQRGREHDALYALALQMRREPVERWPHKLLMLGDQIYVDEGSPRVRERIARRRDTSRPPGREVADFEEYTWLYHESWGDPVLRWLLSTVSSAMLWDDHDMHDDWNISSDWVREIRRKPWWESRVIGGIMSYWIYQHLGNLAPPELRDLELLERVSEADDAGPLLRDYARRADRQAEGSRWSYHRDMGGVRLVAMDSRGGRLLGGTGHGVHEHARAMVDDREWAWIEERATGDVEHLVLATSLPFALVPGLHYLEAWSEAVCDGAWGRRLSALGERVRRAADLEGWPAFQDSFHRLARLIADVAAGRRGRAPASIVIVSGDVHHAYLAEIALAAGGGAVWQAVCSPFRNTLARSDRALLRFGGSRAGLAIARTLARSARVEQPELRWRITTGPWFDNQVATLIFMRRAAELTLAKTVPGDPDPELELVHRACLTPTPSP
ncbi:MAG: alkaline phosphatase D family protein [Thermoleophilaceae bacterium]|nr:alkaline phosphatase D family protein [Thermoleophilaceae bacterium]